MKFNNLLKLAMQNATTPQHIKCEADGDAANVYMKGVISADFGVGADTLRAAFAEADGRPVNLFINSPGGDVFEGREMQGVIASYSGEVTAVIQGVAASAATFVSMAAKRVHMVKGSRYMIHNGWAIAMGGKRDFRDMADLLDGFDVELAAEYAVRTKVDAAKVSAWMDAETWFTADQALENGFVDQVTTNTQNRAMAAAWNLSAYANAPANEPPPAVDPEQIEHQLQMNRNRLRLFQI